jgi:hypothetical protein
MGGAPCLPDVYGAPLVPGAASEAMERSVCESEPDLQKVAFSLARVMP